MWERSPICRKATSVCLDCSPPTTNPTIRMPIPAKKALRLQLAVSIALLSRVTMNFWDYWISQRPQITGNTARVGGLQKTKVKNLMCAPSNPIPLVKRSSEQFFVFAIGLLFEGILFMPLSLCWSGHVSSSLGLNASLCLVMFLLGHFLGPIWCFGALKSLPMIYFGCFQMPQSCHFLGEMAMFRGKGHFESSCKRLKWSDFRYRTNKGP